MIWDQVLRFNASAVIITTYVIFSLNRHIFRNIKQIIIEVGFKLAFGRTNTSMHRFMEYGRVGARVGEPVAGASVGARVGFLVG